MMKILLVFSLMFISGQNSLRINEIVSTPPVGEKDWIELHNDADVDVDLQKYTYHDSKKSHIQKFTGVNIISANGYKIIYPNDDITNPFGLGKNDEFHLYDASGNEIHSTSWEEGDTPLGYSWAYCNGEFLATSTITKDAANICPEKPLVCPKAGTVQISEIKTKNLTGALDDYDWIEVWNPSLSEVANLSCWTVSDSSTGYASRFHVPLGTLVEPQHYYIITLDSKVKLGGSDEVHIFSGEEENNEVDKVSWKSYTNIHESISYCISNLDGSIEWQATALSKGEKNICRLPPISSIEISEIYAANGTEWVEFYNAGSIVKDLTNWRFSDVWKGGNRLPGEQQKIGVGVYPGKYVVVDVGKKFSFSATKSDGCRLYSPTGVLVALTSWSAEKPPRLGTSWSKCPNGIYDVTIIPTKGKANVCDASSGSILNSQISIVWFAFLCMMIF